MLAERIEAFVTAHQKDELGRKIAAEAIGTALLLATVVGSGVMAF